MCDIVKMDKIKNARLFKYLEKQKSNNLRIWDIKYIS